MRLGWLFPLLLSLTLFTRLSDGVIFFAYPGIILLLLLLLLPLLLRTITRHSCYSCCCWHNLLFLLLTNFIFARATRLFILLLLLLLPLFVAVHTAAHNHGIAATTAVVAVGAFSWCCPKYFLARVTRWLILMLLLMTLLHCTLSRYNSYCCCCWRRLFSLLLPFVFFASVWLMILSHPGYFVYQYTGTLYRVLIALRVDRVAHQLIFELDLFWLITWSSRRNMCSLCKYYR